MYILFSGWRLNLCSQNFISILYLEVIHIYKNIELVYPQITLYSKYNNSLTLTISFHYLRQLLCDAADVLSFLADDKSMKPGRSNNLPHYHTFSLRNTHCPVKICLCRVSLEIFCCTLIFSNMCTLAYTCVRAGPSLSGSPLRMMVSDAESRGGISTDTPVFSKISCRVLPFGPTMYLCCDFFTSTEIVVVFRFWL